MTNVTLLFMTLVRCLCSELSSIVYGSFILFDLMMPDMDGFEFIRELRQHPQWRSLPVILIDEIDYLLAAPQREDVESSKLPKGGA